MQKAWAESGLSVNGTSIKVGVLSDSLSDLGGAAADDANGALPRRKAKLGEHNDFMSAVESAPPA